MPFLCNFISFYLWFSTNIKEEKTEKSQFSKNLCRMTNMFTLGVRTPGVGYRSRGYSHICKITAKALLLVQLTRDDNGPDAVVSVCSDRSVDIVCKYMQHIIPFPPNWIILRPSLGLNDWVPEVLICFTDADTWIKPEISKVQNYNLKHKSVILIPEYMQRSISEDTVLYMTRKTLKSTVLM